MPAHALRALPRASASRSTGRHRAPRPPRNTRPATAVGAVLTTGALTVAGVSAAAPAASAAVDARPASQLWLGPAHSLLVRPGTVVRFSAHLGSGRTVWSGQTVRVYERDGAHGPWQVVARSLTNAKGWVGVNLVVRRTSQYQAVFTGSLAWRSSWSNVGVMWTPAPPPPPTPVTAPSLLGPRAIAASLLAQRGWGSQYQCLNLLWTRESNWSITASNASSGAYGIPQALPGSKMATVGADWRYNAATQITWGLNYIGGRYGGPCGAWGHSQAYGWY